MKRLTLTLWLSVFFITAMAQKHPPVNSKQDRQQYNGYSIRLLPARGGTYGYDIFKGAERVVHQSRNPFTGAPAGLAKKKRRTNWRSGKSTRLPAGKARRPKEQRHRERTNTGCKAAACCTIPSCPAT